MEHFLYSINATLPIFLIMLLGKFLHKIGIISSSFTKSADKFVFYVSLPLLLFCDLTKTDLSHHFDSSYLFLCASITFVMIISIWGLATLFVKDKESQGAFIQATYRSSAAILGMAFINNMYSDAGMAPLMIVGSVPLFNIFAVIILTLKGDNNGQKPNAKKIFLDVIKNPILISILIALIVSFCRIPLPTIVTKTTDSIAATTTPLALLSIGACFEGRKALKKIRLTVIASFIKLIACACLFLPLTIYLGIRGAELVAVLIMVASPTTPSCYIMVKNTNNDAVLTSSIIVMTTLFSSVTLTIFIYLLRSLGYI